MNTGDVTSAVQVTVLETVDVLPHASVAVKVLICVLVHPVDVIEPSEELTVGIPQASVAVAEPSAAVIADDVGLHPRACVV